MSIGEVLLSSGVKEMIEACHFFVACHWNQPIDCTVSFFYCKPALANKQKLLVVVEVVNEYTADIP